MADLLKNKYVQIIGTLLIGISIGVIFYPTKQIEERITQEYKKQIENTAEAHAQTVKQLSEAVDVISKQSQQYKEDLNITIDLYENAIRDLRSKITEKTYKLISPDGTILEKTFKESETEEHNYYVKTVREEFNHKIKLIEEKWMQVHKQRVESLAHEYKTTISHLYQEITRLEKQTSTNTNIKKYQVEAGYTTNKNMYVHTAYTLWGPIFIGLHGESNMSGGLGLGISF